MSGELLGTAVLELATDNRGLTTGMARARGTVATEGAAMQASVDKRLVSVGQSVSKVGSTLTRGVTLPLVGAGVAAGAFAVKFQQKMELIHTQAGDTQAAVGRLSKEVLELARSGKVAAGPNDLADALFRLEGAGLKGKQAMDALTASAQLAAVGNASVEDTAKTLAQTWFVGIKGAGTFRDTVAELNATVGAGDLRLQQLVDALGTGVVTSAKQVGLTLQDVTGVLAVFGDETNNVSGWAAQFATSLHFLTNPTNKAIGSLEDIGLTSTSLAVDLHKPRGLVTALGDLKDHLDKLPGGLHGVKADQVLGNIFPGGRGRVLLVLLNQLDRLQQKMGQIKRTNDQFAGDVAKTQETAAFKIHASIATIESDAITFGTKILPPILAVGKDVVAEADKIATAFAKLPPGVQKEILTGGLILAGIGPALKIAGLFTSGIGKLAGITATAARLTGIGGRASSAATEQFSARVATMTVAEMNVLRAVGFGIGASPGGVATAAKPVLLGPNGKPIASAATEAESLGAATETAGLGATLKAGAGTLLGLGGLGLIAAPFAAALTVGVSKWIDHEAERQGKEWADKFLGPLPREIRQKFEKPLTAAAVDVARQSGNPLQRPKVSGAPALTGGRNAANDRAGNVAALRSQDKATFDASFNVGFKAGQAVIAGLQSVKHPSSFLLLRDFESRLTALSSRAQPEAAKVMIEYAAGLAQKGKLPARQVDAIIATLEQQFPKLGSFVHAEGLATDREVASALKFTHATNQLKSTLNDYRTKWGDWSISTNLTAENLNSNIKTAMGHLHDIVTTSTGKLRKDALAELHKLQSGASDTFDKMLSQVQSRQTAMTKAIQSGSAKAATVGGENFANFETSVFNAMNNGVISTTKGADLIGKALNATLKAFGSKQIPLAQLIASEGKNPGGAFKGAAHAGTFAGGGIVQFGRPGDKGRDTIPVSFGGKQIVVGSGEQGLVLTGPQQAFLNARTADVGGLQGVFRSINRKHYMASGGFVADPGTSQTQGQLPQITSRLNTLAHALGVTIYGLSGYRSPAHSIAVGGFGNDPHTQGQAEDIAVNGQSRASAAQISTAMLHRFGLDRPFDESDDPSNSEVNHIQLLGSALAGAVGPGVASAIIQQITGPKVTGNGTVARIVRGALKLATAGANSRLSALAGSLGGTSGGNAANQALGRQMMLADGWGADQWPSLLALWNQESGWNADAVNPSSGAYGIPQALGHGHPYALGDAASQISWGLNYIRGRYGSPSAAEAHERAFNWYGGGGFTTDTRKASKPGPNFPWKRKKPPTIQDSQWKPVDATGTPGIDQALATLNGLLGDSGDIASLQDRYQQTDALFQALHPDLNYVVSQDASGNPVTPFIDWALGPDGQPVPDLNSPHAVNLSLGELDELYGWQSQIVGDYQRAMNLIPHVLKLIAAAIKERQRKMEALKAQIRKNLAKVAKLQKDAGQTDPNILKLKQEINSAGTGNQSLTSLRRQLATAEAIEVPSGSKGDKARAARDKLIGSLEGKITQSEHGQRVSVAGLRNELLGVEAHDKDRKSGLTDQIKAIEKTNQQLGGDATKIGTGGQLGTLAKQVQALQGHRSDLTGDQLTIAGASGIGGELGSAKVNLATLSGQIGQLSPTVLGQQLSQASSASTPTGPDLSAQLALETQLATTNAQTAAVLRGELDVLSHIGDLPPFGGSFATGGIVPGPIGAARTVIAHGGEKVTPVGGGDRHQFHVIVHDGAVDTRKIEVIADGVTQRATRVMARNAINSPPSRGGGRR